jgi:hypothetical protein
MASCVWVRPALVPRYAVRVQLPSTLGAVMVAKYRQHTSENLILGRIESYSRLWMSTFMQHLDGARKQLAISQRAAEPLASAFASTPHTYHARHSGMHRRRACPLL